MIEMDYNMKLHDTITATNPYATSIETTLQGERKKKLK